MRAAGWLLVVLGFALAASQIFTPIPMGALLLIAVAVMGAGWALVVRATEREACERAQGTRYWLASCDRAALRAAMRGER